MGSLLLLGRSVDLDVRLFVCLTGRRGSEATDSASWVNGGRIDLDGGGRWILLR